MKRSINRALSMLLAIVMILGLVTVLPATAAGEPKLGTVAGKMWYAPVKTDFTTTIAADWANGGEVATVEGITLSLVPSSWKSSNPNDDGKKLGLVGGLSSDTQASKDNAKVVPTAGSTEAIDVPNKGAAFKFVADSGVAEGTTLKLYYKANDKANWILEDGKLLTLDAATEINTGVASSINPGPVEIPVKAGSTYFYFASGGNAVLFGFEVVVPGAKEETVAVESVALDRTSATIEVGKTTTLSPVFEPKNATNKTVYWTSSDTSVVTVNDEGQITAKAVGTAKITVRTDDGNKTAECAVTVKAATVAADNEWIANLEDIKASNNGSLEVPASTPALLVNTKVPGVKFYIGGGAKSDGTPNTYKIVDNSGVGMADALSTSQANSLAADGKGVSATDPVPASGTYYKWEIEEDGVLEFVGFHNNKPIYITQNGVALPSYNGVSAAKAELPVVIVVKKGDVVTYGMAGSKPMLASFKFTVTKKVGGTWVANLEDIKASNDGSLEVPASTPALLVNTDVTGVKFYIGGGEKDGTPNTYKIVDNSGVGMADALSTSQANSLAADGKGVSATDPVPASGTYYKWEIEEDGVLEFVGFHNNKPIYITQNGVALPSYNGVSAAKAELPVRIVVKKGDVITYAMAASKPMLASFSFEGGGLAEKEADWTKETILGSSVSITGSDKKDGSLNVVVSGPRVGLYVDMAANTAWTCADYMYIEMYNEAGELQDSVLTMEDGDAHSAVFHPSLSGKYTFKAVLSREGEADLATEMSAAVDFVLPIPKPVVTVGVLDGGKLNVSWPRFVEATGYKLYMADSEAGLASATAVDLTVNEYTTGALTEGTTYYFKVKTLRNAEESALSDAASGIPSAEKKTLWNYTYYGTSTSKWSDKDNKGNDSNLFEVYPDGVIKMKDSTPFQIRSWGSSGKVQEGDQDGVSFVYTRVPASQNFTLKAKIKVVKWKFEGQEGMGLMATDALGAGNDQDKKDQNNVFVNNYMVGAMRFGNGSLGATFDKAFKGDKGVGMIQEVGNPNPSVKPATWDYDQINLDPYPEEKGMTSGIYNILGNECDSEGNILEALKDPNKGSVKKGYTMADPLVTEFTLEIERNNTGIFGRYYLPNGTVKVAKTFDRDALLQQDPDSMYVGFFAARHMIIEVSEVELNVDDPENYPPAEIPETTYITPRIKVGTPTFSNTENYNLILTSNVVGTATVSVGGTTETVELVKQKESDKSTGANDYVTRGEVELPMKNGTNQIKISFQPAEQEDQGFAPYYELRNTNKVNVDHSVTYQNKFEGRNNLYVSPKGTYGGYGTKEKPLDIYTAVKVAQPGQKVILMEGTYNLKSTITIEKGISGTQAEPIYLMADPEAESRIVLDGSGLTKSSGIVLKGDYWHFYNFVVQNCGGSGVAVNGSNNVIEYVDVISNQNTGLQIARGGEVDGVLKYWPSNNLILNCLAMNNRDESWGSADGFAAKLTCGTGNVFRYCVAAYNADDGWDLFAKSEDGPIGDVIIENCVVYKSGYGLDADGKEITNPDANGNGFKMGGSGVYGNHKVLNSYSFYNKAKGVDSNSGPNTEAHNVVSFNNIGPNIRFYTDTNVANTNYAVDNFISFKNDELKGVIYVNSNKEYDSYSEAKDEVNVKGTQKKSKWQNDTAYYWTGSATKSTGGTIADPASLFVSTDFNDLVIGYDENGNLCTGDFLKLKTPVPANLKDVVPSTDPANYHSPENLMVMPDKSMSDPYFITPDTAFVVPTNTSSGGGGGRGGEDTDPVTGNTVSKRTTANGTTLITVTDPTGEVLVDMSLPASVPATDKKFVDVADDHWATDAIYEMAGRGIVKGVDDEHFNPNSNVTRGTLATMLFRLSNGKEGYPNTFSDVKDNSWYKDAVAWAAKVGVVTGYNNGAFGGDDVITREQLAVMLYRYANLLGLKATKTAELGAFVDGTTVSDWAAEGMNWAVANGIINGVGNDTLAPKATATRAQATLMLQRFIALLK